jgi:predicted ATP-dependent serine protease
MGWGDPVECELDENKNYVGLKIVKNRLGSKGDLICFEVQMNENIWKEVGVLKKKH